MHWHYNVHLIFLVRIPEILKHENVLIKQNFISANNYSDYGLDIKYTFMSSTKEGNPPMVIKVSNEATYMSIDPLACNKCELYKINVSLRN